MPAVAFLAWVGLALAALLFVADATLVDGPAIVVSQRIGLPEPWHPDRCGTNSHPKPNSDTRNDIAGSDFKPARVGG